MNRLLRMPKRRARSDKGRICKLDTDPHIIADSAITDVQLMAGERLGLRDTAAIPFLETAMCGTPATALGAANRLLALL